MSELETYIPMDRRQALARRESLPDHAMGTALFTDISGFTPLTAVLAEELGSQRGAEAITQHLNEIYGRLIRVVHQYRGSVIGFSGDAITCWFDGDDGLRGANAAYSMQQLVADMDVISTPSGQQIVLSIKTAVANGSVRRCLVGVESINIIDVLAGKLLDTIASIEQSLSRGEIGLDLKMAAAIGKNSDVVNHQITKQGDSFFLLNSPPPKINASYWPDHAFIPNEIVGQWLLPPVLQQLERGQADFLAELRLVVACFINFTGIDYDGDPDAADKLNAFIQYVQTTLARYGGHLLEITIGDKGSYLYTAFGAPQANEDDADRAISAASVLIKAKEKFEYIHDLKTGISRGRMRTGAYGSEFRRIYGVHGTDVNLAARLMSQAESGQILVSKHLTEASRDDQYSFQEVGDVQLKGFSQSITTYIVLKREEKLTTPLANAGDIVGRDSERFLFSQYLFALRNGESNLVLVEGEAGIGKSFLVSDFLKIAQSRNFIYLLGAGDAIGQATPYQAWREIVQQLLGVPLNTVTLDEDIKRVLQQKVLARLHYLDPALVPFAPLLNIFLPLDFSEDALTSQMSEVARADNINDLVIRLVQETAVSAPVLLVFEDAHWMDSASLTLLSLVQRTVSPLLIVIVTRPQTSPFTVDYTQFLDHPDTHHLVLNILSKEAIDTLVCKRLGVKQLPQPIAQLIHEKAEGHPFFSEEMAYSLRDSQIIQIDDGVCYLSTNVDQLTSLVFPDTIQGVIISRLDQLAPQHQITLKVASVIGRLFAFHILQDIYPDHVDKQYLKENILELEQLEITLQETPEPNLAYIFKHIITQEVTYNLMTFEQRQQLHRRTAEVYERFFVADMSNTFELLAHHWSKAEDNTKAIHYLERAGEQAFKNAANAEAIYFFAQALTLDKEAGFICDKHRRARWELMSGIAYVNWSRYQSGLQHLDAGLTLLGKPRPADSILKKVVRTAQQILRQDMFKIRAPQHEKKSAEERETLLAASRAYARLVEVDYHLGDLVGSIFDSFYALNLAEEAGPSTEYAEAAAPVGIFWGLLPWRSRAEAYLDHALETAEIAKNNEVLSYTLMVKGTYQAGIGQWVDAQTLYEKIIALNKQFASRRLNDGYHHLARAYYLQGRYEDSWKTAVSLINSAKKLNDQRFEAYGIQCQAYVLLYQGRLRESLNNLDILYELFSTENKIDDEQMELDTYGLLALAHLRLGNREKAFQMAGLADALASPFPSGYYNLPGYANSAEVYLSLWEQNYFEPSLQKLTQQACKVLNKYASIFTLGKPRAYLLQGRYAWQKGKKRKAYKVWQKGLITADTLKMLYEQGCLHFEMGRHSEETLNRKDHLQKAQIIFEELGAAYDLKQFEKLP